MIEAILIVLVFMWLGVRFEEVAALLWFTGVLAVKVIAVVFVLLAVFAWPAMMSAGGVN